MVKADYAKWMLDDPRVNFAISSGKHARKGIEHLGIQAEDGAELAEVYGRLRPAGRPVLEEGATTCCYAKSEKSWIADPDGVVWEAFHTTGEATVYGDSPALDALGTAACARRRARQMLRARAMAEPPLAPAAGGGGDRRLLPVRHRDRLGHHGRESVGRERCRRAARQHPRHRARSCSC